MENSGTSMKQKQKSKRHKNVTVESSNFCGSDKYMSHNQERKNSKSCGSSPNKQQIPTPFFGLTPAEEAELRDVIMQMTLRDCGL